MLRCFDRAHRTRGESIPTRKRLTSNPPSKVKRRTFSSTLARAPVARLSEPILIPKVRIEFADFPYPHASDSTEANNL